MSEPAFATLRTPPLLITSLLELACPRTSADCRR
jgi:hypothetical protein